MARPFFHSPLDYCPLVRSLAHSPPHLFPPSLRPSCPHLFRHTDIDNEILGPAPADASIYAMAAVIKFKAGKHVMGLSACLMVLGALARYGNRSVCALPWSRVRGT